MTKNEEIYGASRDFGFEKQTIPMNMRERVFPKPEKKYRSIQVTDSIVDNVVDKFIDRAAKGKAKYNNDMDRTDLSLVEWLDHAIEEHMDAILYLNKIKKELNGKI